jgi:plastocyanin
MTNLDSRYLALGDCFAQIFPAAGNIRYRLSMGLPWFANAEATGANAFDLEVRPRSSKKAPPSHKTVLVKRTDNGLAAEPAAVSIEAGDTVVWYTSDKTLQGFSVLGSGEKFSFNSASITGESAYTHVFGLPGTYQWVDAIHHSVRGVIRVKPFDATGEAGRREWLEAMKKPLSIEITGHQVTHAELDIVVGQTVFWHVKKSQGISITDARLVRGK